MPKGSMARAISSPSRCCEISILMGLERFHAFGIISSRPCQKHRMNGLPAFQNESGYCWPCTSQREVAWTKRIYRAIVTAAKRTAPLLRSRRFTRPDIDELYRRLDGELGGIETRIGAVPGQQLGMAALFDKAALIQHEDHVGINHGRQAMGDDEGRATLHQFRS